MNQHHITPDPAVKRFSVPRRAAVMIVIGALPFVATSVQRAGAITISIEHTPEGENPAWDPDGSILTAHFQSAKAIWEALLPGDGDYSFDFHWDDDLEGDTLGSTSGGIIGEIDKFIEIDPIHDWFADPTPNENSEFNFANQQVVYSQLSFNDQVNNFPGT